MDLSIKLALEGRVYVLHDNFEPSPYIRGLCHKILIVIFDPMVAIRVGAHLEFFPIAATQTLLDLALEP